jgi:AcrR family transcriptional regulator
MLTACIAEIRAVGYDALSLEAVAARAGVGRATLYRRWADKEHLVAEALERLMRVLPVPDTGSTRGDLAAVMRESLALHGDPATGELLSGLVSAMARSRVIAGAMRDGFIATRRAAIEQVLRRAVRRGDLRRGLDYELAVDVLSAPFVYRALITGARIDRRSANTLVALFMRAFAPDSHS